MIDVLTWFKAWDKAHKPFLILGKGPSFSRRRQFDLDKFNTISLNHVIREQKVDIAHIIDIDVVENCADCLLEQASWLLMPLVPHVKCRPTEMRLSDFVNTLPVLKEFQRQNRLIWYPLWSGPKVSELETVTGTFSGSVVINLLSKLGVTEIRSIGIDGGNNYDVSFKDLTEATLFKNQHHSFDIQFSEIEESVMNSKINYQAMVEPIRVFIACEDSMMVPAKVLEYSIRKHTDWPVEIFFMRNMPTPRPKHKKNRPGTGFSFNRFLIPKIAGYKGKAIYIDSDMLVLDDIAKLWNIPFKGKKVLCSTQTETPVGWEDGKNNDLGEERYWTPGIQLSVMLLDCEKLDWDIDNIINDLDQGKYSYKELMAKLCIVKEEDIGGNIPNEWNCLEWYEEGRSQLVHFTVVPTQPWRNDRSTLIPLWETALTETIEQGMISFEEIEDSVNKKHIRPSLLEIAKEASQRQSNLKSEINTATFSEQETEEVRLRHMLWDSMVQAYKAESELDRIHSSPAFWIEDTFVRKPWAFAIRVLRWLHRKIT